MANFNNLDKVLKQFNKNIAIYGNLLNQETSFKRSTRQKARRASMDKGYLLKVLAASIPLQSNLSDS